MGEIFEKNRKKAVRDTNSDLEMESGLGTRAHQGKRNYLNNRLKNK